MSDRLKSISKKAKAKVRRGADKAGDTYDDAKEAARRGKDRADDKYDDARAKAVELANDPEMRERARRVVEVATPIGRDALEGVVEETGIGKVGADGKIKFKKRAALKVLRPSRTARKAIKGAVKGAKRGARRAAADVVRDRFKQEPEGLPQPPSSPVEVGAGQPALPRAEQPEPPTDLLL
ncbi:MAG: hypothetical protein M3P98_04150 [bacterium]|nr:hypothetical protein [bacterium]